MNKTLQIALVKMSGLMIVSSLLLSPGKVYGQNEGSCGWINPQTGQWVRLSFCNKPTHQSPQEVTYVKQGIYLDIAYNVVAYPDRETVYATITNKSDRPIYVSAVTVRFSNIGSTSIPGNNTRILTGQSATLQGFFPSGAHGISIVSVEFSNMK